MCKTGDVSIFTFLSFAIFGNTASLSRVQEPNVDKFYTFESTIRLREFANNNPAEAENVDDIAYRITGNMQHSIVWQNSNDELEKLFYLQISSLKFLVNTQKNATSKFIEQPLKVIKNEPFLVYWNNYKIEKIYLNPAEETFIVNLKKAISSLFQYQLTHSHGKEADICGVCSVSYEIIDDKTILKRKKNCESHLPVSRRPEKILGTETEIRREILYQLSDDNSKNIVRVTSHENLDLNLSMKREIGVSVVATLDVKFSGTKSSNMSMLPMKSVDETVNEILNNFGFKLKSDALYITEEPSFAIEEKSLTKLIQENREHLKESNLGTIKSVTAFLEVLRGVYSATENEILKVIKNKKNEPILNQILDILGCAQTLNAHKAVMKTFDFVTSSAVDSIERYLWALSIGRKPRLEFIKDLIHAIKKEPQNDKLMQTLTLSLAALAQKYSSDMVTQVYSLIMELLSKCKSNDDQCIANYLRTLKNLQYPESKSILLKHALTGSRIVSVTALKVLYSLPSAMWDAEVLKTAEKIYYQKDKIYDSSARAIAADIIVDTIPNTETLRHLLKSLSLNTSSEVRKYLLQRLYQLASSNHTFYHDLRRLLKEENLNHYGALALKGLSSALTKNIFEDRDLNASLFSINEVSKGALKRSHISVSLGRNDTDWKIGAFEVYTGGLSSFLWSDDTSVEEELDEVENLTAGIELTVFGVQLRPFVFFSGHTELMGHIWSGTASERTTALQALTLLHDHRQFIPLTTGNVFKFDLLGASSFDLAGQIQFSIWNRNAHSFVESKVGIAVQGSASIDTFFARNKIDFEISSEQKVEMTADLDFYDEVAFCLQISQTDSLVKCDIEKTQKMLQTGRNRRRKKHKRLLMSGRTFALNQKNNEMCNDIFRQRRK